MFSVGCCAGQINNSRRYSDESLYKMYPSQGQKSQRLYVYPCHISIRVTNFNYLYSENIKRITDADLDQSSQQKFGLTNGVKSQGVIKPWDHQKFPTNVQNSFSGNIVDFHQYFSTPMVQSIKSQPQSTC